MIWLVGIGIILLLAIAYLCTEMYFTLHKMHETIILIANLFANLTEINREIPSKLGKIASALDEIERHSGRIARPMHEADNW